MQKRPSARSGSVQALNRLSPCILQSMARESPHTSVCNVTTFKLGPLHLLTHVLLGRHPNLSIKRGAKAPSARSGCAGLKSAVPVHIHEGTRFTTHQCVFLLLIGHPHLLTDMSYSAPSQSYSDARALLLRYTVAICSGIIKIQAFSAPYVYTR